MRAAKKNDLQFTYEVRTECVCQNSHMVNKNKNIVFCQAHTLFTVSFKKRLAF